MIQTSNKIEIENAIIDENLKWFELAYNSHLFSKEILPLFRDCGENKPIYNLRHNKTPLEIENNKIKSFC